MVEVGLVVVLFTSAIGLGTLLSGVVGSRLRRSQLVRFSLG